MSDADHATTVALRAWLGATDAFVRVATAMWAGLQDFAYVDQEVSVLNSRTVDIPPQPVATSLVVQPLTRPGSPSIGMEHVALSKSAVPATAAGDTSDPARNRVTVTVVDPPPGAVGTYSGAVTDATGKAFSVSFTIFVSGAPPAP